jgi:transcriptional regulator with AAA-type ATPase domain/tetratricopeptide (TPR) repeat protein
VPLDQLIGNSPASAALREQLSRLVGRLAASSKRLPPILITGETGTGKGLVARLVHELGPRSAAPFVDVNCAAIPDTLLEAELFGFERGAFTDAKQAKAGLLQVAHRGTIFLDEIGLMPDALQAKLLKVIEDRTVRRLGSTRTEPADPLVLAATSEDLPAAIRMRRFREDLFHRLSVVNISLPPLRERGSDVLEIARHYLDRAAREYGVPAKTLAADADAALLAYPWPGNIRELANVMERVALLSDADHVSADALHLPRAPRTAAPPRSGETVNDQLASLERVRLEEALRAEAWNISRAAARLGIPRNTLRYRMERYGLFEGDVAPQRRRGDAPARSGDQRPPARAEAPVPVRWQRTRITLFQAQVIDRDGGLAEHQRTRMLEQIAAKATAFGGRVIEVGDASVRAVFGLDVAEGAASHAAHAAFAAHREIDARRADASPVVGIALHTEEMLVGRLDDRVELDAEARQSAERILEALLVAASDDPIVASPATRPFLERRFELEPTTASADDRRPWRVLRLADSDQHATPFVSRERELALLDDLLRQVEQGRGQGLLVAGDPGIGKSRLLREFRRRTRARATWLQGSAVSFGSALPFHPLIDLLKQAFSVQPGDTDADIDDRISRATTTFGEDFRTSAQFLRALLSVDSADSALTRLDPQLRRAGIFEAIAQFLHALSEARPLIVVLEDLHWMDPATGEFLTMMAERLVSGRILLCATHRTGYTLAAAHGAFATQLTIAGVSSADTGTIGGSLLGAAALSDELQQLVERKADGNPFFIEEMLRSLKERGLVERRGDVVDLVRPIDRIDVPDSVRDLLLGRLGRLDPSSRELLRVAAVIGREFPRRVLERVITEGQPTIEDRLRALRAADLIHNARVWPELVYAFKHALTHEVTYDAQDAAERRADHARIGEAVEQVYADRPSEHFGVLAHHFTQAEKWSQALEYLLGAAQQAERTFATREALALYDQALRAAGRLAGGVGDPATLIKIHEAKARLYFAISDFERSAAEGERILPLARLTADRRKEAEALAIIAWAWTWGRKIDDALRYAGEALAVAEPAGALAVQGRANLVIGFVRGVTGSLNESHVALEKAMAISKSADDAVHRSLSLSVAGLLRNWKGEYGEAARLQTEGLQLAREQGLLVPMLFSCFMRGLTLTGKGDYDEAFAMFTEGLSLAERIGDEAIHHRLLNCLGWLYADLGDLDHAETLNMSSAQIGRRRLDPGTQPNAELNLAEIFCARSELARAQDQYDEVFRYFNNRSTSDWMRYRYSIRMFAGLGALAVARGDLAAARSHSAECLTLATRTGSRKNLVKAWRLAGDLAAAVGDRDVAEGHFRTSRDHAAALGNPVQHWKAELALGHFYKGTARATDAHEAFQRAFAVMQRVRQSLREEVLRAAFDKNPDLRLVQDLVAHL